MGSRLKEWKGIGKWESTWSSQRIEGLSVQLLNSLSFFRKKGGKMPTKRSRRLFLRQCGVRVNEWLKRFLCEIKIGFLNLRRRRFCLCSVHTALRFTVYIIIFYSSSKGIQFSSIWSVFFFYGIYFQQNSHLRRYVVEAHARQAAFQSLNFDIDSRWRERKRERYYLSLSSHLYELLPEWRRLILFF